MCTALPPATLYLANVLGEVSGNNTPDAFAALEATIIWPAENCVHSASSVAFCVQTNVAPFKFVQKLSHLFRKLLTFIPQDAPVRRRAHCSAS